MDLGDISKNFEGFQKMMKEINNGQGDKPIPEHHAFIPQQQRSNVLYMTSRPLTGDTMSTIFIGTIRPNYTEEMWQEDVRNWKEHLGDHPYYSIDLQPVSEPHDDPNSIGGSTLRMVDRLDSKKGIPKIESALQAMNALPAGERIRVIILGTGYSQFSYDSITYMLREWKDPSGTARTGKHMQFITSGDTKKRDMNHFCQWLCITGICQSIEFYNTHNYHPFGFCKLEYGAGANKN